MGDVPITRVSNGNNPAGDRSTVPASTPPVSSSPPLSSDALEGARAPVTQPQAEGPRPTGSDVSPEASHTIDSGFNPNSTDGTDAQNYLQQFLDAQNTAPDIREEAQRLDNELNQMLNQGPPSTPEEVASRTRQLQDWNTRAMQLVQTQANHDRELAESHEAKSSAREEQRSEQKFRASEDLTRYVEAKNKQVEAGIPNGNKYKPLQMAAKDGGKFASQVRQDLRAEERYRENVQVAGKAKDFQSLLHGGKKPQGGLASGKGNPVQKGESFVVVRDGKLVKKGESKAEPNTTEVASEGEEEEGATAKTGKSAKPTGKTEPKSVQRGNEAVGVAEGEQSVEEIAEELVCDEAERPDKPSRADVAIAGALVCSAIPEETRKERLAQYNARQKKGGDKVTQATSALALICEEEEDAKAEGKHSSEQAEARALCEQNYCFNYSKKWQACCAGEGAIYDGGEILGEPMRQVLGTAKEGKLADLRVGSNSGDEILSATPGTPEYDKYRGKLNGLLATASPTFTSDFEPVPDGQRQGKDFFCTEPIHA